MLRASGPDECQPNLIVNRAASPFDNPDLRRAVSLGLDRKAFVDIMTEDRDIGGRCSRRPKGIWGMPPKWCNPARLWAGCGEEPRRSARS